MCVVWTVRGRIPGVNLKWSGLHHQQLYPPKPTVYPVDWSFCLHDIIIGHPGCVIFFAHKPSNWSFVCFPLSACWWAALALLLPSDLLLRLPCCGTDTATSFWDCIFQLFRVQHSRPDGRKTTFTGLPCACQPCRLHREMSTQVLFLFKGLWVCHHCWPAGFVWI